MSCVSCKVFTESRMRAHVPAPCMLHAHAHAHTGSKVAYKCLSRPFDRTNSIHMLSGEAYDVDAHTLVFMR